MRTTSVGAGPGFVVDHGFQSRNSGRQVDWALVPESKRATPGQTVKLNGAAIATATSITVDALAQALPSGTVLNFTGVNKFAQTTAAAAAGATTVAVAALPEALADNDEAIVAGSGDKHLPAGTIVSESISGNVRKIYPRIGTAAGADSTIGVLASDADEDNDSDSLSGYGVITEAKVYEALLPEASGTPRVIAAPMRAELLALGFTFEPYTDSTTA